MSLLRGNALHRGVVGVFVGIVTNNQSRGRERMDDLSRVSRNCAGLDVSGTLSRIRSSIGVAEAIFAETENRRRGKKPGILRESIGDAESRQKK